MMLEEMDTRTALRYLSRELAIACARIQTLEKRVAWCESFAPVSPPKESTG